MEGIPVYLFYTQPKAENPRIDKGRNLFSSFSSIASSHLVGMTLLHRSLYPMIRPFHAQRFRTFITLARLYKRILYFSALGTLLITKRPSYDSDANTQGSAIYHSTAYTLSSCSSNVAMTPSFVGSRDLDARMMQIVILSRKISAPNWEKMQAYWQFCSTNVPVFAAG